jgi:hypothetical protein
MGHDQTFRQRLLLGHLRDMMDAEMSAYRGGSKWSARQNDECGPKRTLAAPVGIEPEGRAYSPNSDRDTESFAFSFESKVRRHLLPKRLSALGVPDGPVRKDLAEGRSVVLPDDRRIDSEDVLGPPEGRSSSWGTQKRPTAWPSTSGTRTSW